MLYYPKKTKSDGSKYKVVLFAFVVHLQGNVAFSQKKLGVRFIFNLVNIKYLKYYIKQLINNK